MKKRSLFTGLGFALWGALVLLNNLGKPRVQTLHAPDIIGIMASGFCFGIAFMFLLMGFMPRKVIGGGQASSASTFLLPRSTHGCNSALWPAAGETAARILSADMGGFAAGAPVASGLCSVRNGSAGVYNPRVGPWEVKAPRSSCAGEDSTPLRGDSRHPV